MNVLMIGGTGMVGSHLRRWCARGRPDLAIVQASRHAHPNYLDCRDAVGLKSNLTEIMDRRRIDLVIQAQTPGSSAWCEQNPGETFRVIVGAAAEIDTVCQIQGVGHILLSTGSVYEGNIRTSQGPYGPHVEPIPTSVYGRAKRLAEGLTHGLILRFGVYGYQLRNPRFYSRAYTEMKSGQLVPFDCSDNAWISPASVDELIQSLVGYIDGYAATGRVENEIVHITNDRRETVYRWALRMAAENSYPPHLVRGVTTLCEATDVSLSRS